MGEVNLGHNKFSRHSRVSSVSRFPRSKQNIAWLKAFGRSRLVVGCILPRSHIPSLSVVHEEGNLPYTVSQRQPHVSSLCRNSLFGRPFCTEASHCPLHLAVWVTTVFRWDKKRSFLSNSWWPPEYWEGWKGFLVSGPGGGGLILLGSSGNGNQLLEKAVLYWGRTNETLGFGTQVLWYFYRELSLCSWGHRLCEYVNRWDCASLMLDI